jgi:tripeptide aminopeptidase
VPTIGLLAHVDTSPSVSGTNVRPQRVRYEGGKLALPADPSQVLDPDELPELAAHAGHELITSDGTTLLGADDKAGVAEIMAAAAYLVAHPEIPHGQLRIGFTPDEEVGAGTKYFDLERFGAVAAYTLDGSTAGELQEETFSGAAVKMRIKGRSIHPGWAKGAMVNAVKLAGEILARLPKDTLSPETTDGRAGYVHPNWIGGEDAEVELRFIARDFENDLLDAHVQRLRDIAAEVAALDPRASIEVESSISYRNIRDALKTRPEIVAAAEEAIRRVGLEPRKTAIRGGTDGSVLTEKGLPTPNIFTGGQQAHSEREWICVEDMGLAAATIVELAKVWPERS